MKSRYRLLSRCYKWLHRRRSLVYVSHEFDRGVAEEHGWCGLRGPEQWHHLRVERAAWHEALDLQRWGHSRPVALLCGDGLRRNTHSTRWGQSGSTAIFKPYGQPAHRLPLDTTISLVEHSPVSALSGGPADNPFALEHGLIYN